MAEPRSRILSTSPVFLFVWNDKERSSKWLKHMLDISRSEYCITGAHYVVWVSMISRTRAGDTHEHVLHDGKHAASTLTQSQHDIRRQVSPRSCSTSSARNLAHIQRHSQTRSPSPSYVPSALITLPNSCGTRTFTPRPRTRRPRQANARSWSLRELRGQR